MQKLTLQFAANHPTGAGHFPGNPIIPGALLLADVLSVISKASNMYITNCNVQSAKFQHPVRPGDKLDIEYDCSANQVISFKCTVAGQIVLSGVISATFDT